MRSLMPIRRVRERPMLVVRLRPYTVKQPPPWETQQQPRPPVPDNTEQTFVLGEPTR